jgi:antitoxin component YwqK of YwqJK toxin-antitoxin module
MLRIDINDPNLILRETPTNWGDGVYLYNGQPITGLVYEYYPNSNQLSSESEHKDGILDGRQVEYWPNGNLKEEYYQKYDYLIGSFKVWSETGELISYSEYDFNGNKIKKII